MKKLPLKSLVLDVPGIRTRIFHRIKVFDVGPVTRQSLTRTEGFFDDLLLLTLCDKLIRGQVPE